MINLSAIEIPGISSCQEQCVRSEASRSVGLDCATVLGNGSRMLSGGNNDGREGNWHGNVRTRRSAGRRIEKALEYMLQHVDQPLQMASISKLSGVSESTFYYLFKLATGYTPNDLFIRVRMQHAGGLLRETDLSVKEVAAALGYDDPFYFSRIFKSVHGVSPRGYRNHPQSQLDDDAGPGSPKSNFQS